MLYEIRRYQVKPGRRDEWVRYMEETIMPYLIERGMSVTASFLDEEDENGYIWIRRFEDEQERDELYAAVYESDRWQREISPVVSDLVLLDEITVTRAVPTRRSVLR
ncbi:MAG: family containing protein [Amycolatopsis sp.]|jgi:hypothetical protein|uniref:NIPSNAP family protein n=1 Tax=Amycolatopsis sp. TaxID=37632 RepID=UPI00260E693C|nr:NIPSNAP family protein [Amycolatopsis sp.]MCU1686596.1 family containing protein [Amycolatopsis sp.]